METSIEEGIVRVLNEVGEKIVSILKSQAPKKTGALRDSIVHKVSKQGNDFILDFGYLQYGIFVSLGTYGNADKSAYGMSVYDLPKWNPRPGKGGYGIRPRYWTSLSENANEIAEELNTKIAEVMEKGITGE